MRKVFNPTFIKAFILNAFGFLKNDPIFILGSGRCGSSLLVDVLDTNQVINISQNEWYDTFLKRLKKGFIGHEFLTDIIDFESITKKSIESWSIIDRLYIKLILKYLSNQRQKVFFFKSPAISLMLNEVDHFFPNAKYIHLYRNGYAVVQSIYKKEYFRVKRYRETFNDLEFKKFAAKYWVLSTVSIDDFLNNKPDSLQFSYEDFTSRPKYYVDLIHDSFNVPGEVVFDFSKISSRNYKMNNLLPIEIKELSSILGKVLKSKGYNVIQN